MGFYSDKKIVITGGAGFIGSHLYKRLLTKHKCNVVLGDNFSNSKPEVILNIWRDRKISYSKTKGGYIADNGDKLIVVELADYSQALNLIKGRDIVFHLAAKFGGRGYIDSHPADCCEIFATNQNVIHASYIAGVDRIQYASSACVYPSDLQNSYSSSYQLKEADAFKDEWANADREYGWAKLMGEITLKAYHKQYGLKSSVTRYVTAYGPGEDETHAIIALIQRALKKEDPFVVWGTGNQDRDFTYVDDIVTGTLLACERVTNAEPLNIGTGKRYTIKSVIEKIFENIGWKPKRIIFDKTKPEGVKSRSLSTVKISKILGWKPKISLDYGINETIKWYYNL